MVAVNRNYMWQLMALVFQGLVCRLCYLVPQLSIAPSQNHICLGFHDSLDEILKGPSILF